MEEEQEFDIGELTRLHRATFTMEDTAVGDIVLRALSRKKAGVIGEMLIMQDPIYAEFIKEYLYLSDILKHQEALAKAAEEGGHPPPDGLDTKQMARLSHLSRRLSEWSDWFGIECFVKPVLTHPDQLEALSSELDTEDFNQLDDMLKVLANPMPPSEANAKIGEICVKYGLPMEEGMTAENITVQQSAVLDEAIERENVKAMEMMGLGDGSP